MKGLSTKNLITKVSSNQSTKQLIGVAQKVLTGEKAYNDANLD